MEDEPQHKPLSDYYYFELVTLFDNIIADVEEYPDNIGDINYMFARDITTSRRYSKFIDFIKSIKAVMLDIILDPTGQKTKEDNFISEIEFQYAQDPDPNKGDKRSYVRKYARRWVKHHHGIGLLFLSYVAGLITRIIHILCDKNEPKKRRELLEKLLEKLFTYGRVMGKKRFFKFLEQKRTRLRRKILKRKIPIPFNRESDDFFTPTELNEIFKKIYEPYVRQYIGSYEIIDKEINPDEDLSEESIEDYQENNDSDETSSSSSTTSDDDDDDEGEVENNQNPSIPQAKEEEEDGMQVDTEPITTASNFNSSNSTGSNKNNLATTLPSSSGNNLLLIKDYCTEHLKNVIIPFIKKRKTLFSNKMFVQIFKDGYLKELKTAERETDFDEQMIFERLEDSDFIKETFVRYYTPVADPNDQNFKKSVIEIFMRSIKYELHDILWEIGGFLMFAFFKLSLNHYGVKILDNVVKIILPELAEFRLLSPRQFDKLLVKALRNRHYYILVSERPFIDKNTSREVIKDDVVKGFFKTTNLYLKLLFKDTYPTFEPNFTILTELGLITTYPPVTKIMEIKNFDFTGKTPLERTFAEAIKELVPLLEEIRKTLLGVEVFTVFAHQQYDGMLENLENGIKGFEDKILYTMEFEEAKIIGRYGEPTITNVVKTLKQQKGAQKMKKPQLQQQPQYEITADNLRKYKDMVKKSVFLTTFRLFVSPRISDLITSGILRIVVQINSSYQFGQFTKILPKLFALGAKAKEAFILDLQHARMFKQKFYLKQMDTGITYTDKNGQIFTRYGLINSLDNTFTFYMKTYLDPEYEIPAFEILNLMVTETNTEPRTNSSSSSSANS